MKYKTAVQCFMIIGSMLYISCSPNFIQKAYIVNSPNVNCFQKLNEKDLRISGSIHQFEIQSGIALTDKFGIAPTIYGGWGTPWKYGGEIGGIFYNNHSDRYYYELQAGYGYFRNRSDIDRLTCPSNMTYKSWYRQDVDISYQKIFLQPTAFYIAKYFKIGLSVKFNALYFNKYFFNYETEEESIDGPTFNEIHTSIASFKDAWSFVMEPALTVKFKPGFYIQAIKPFCGNIYTTQIYKGWGAPGTLESGMLKHPQVSKLVISVGFEFNLDKKVTKPRL
jgi:hypothetical protein